MYQYWEMIRANAVWQHTAFHQSEVKIQSRYPYNLISLIRRKNTKQITIWYGSGGESKESTDLLTRAYDGHSLKIPSPMLPT